MSFGGFGAPSAPFGQSSAAPSFGSFGASSGGGAFGSSAPSGGLFGGSAPSGGLFGAQPAAAGGAFGAPTGAAQVGGGIGAGSGDYEVPRDANFAQDAISCVEFSPMANSSLLLSASWDGKVRCYDVQDQMGMLKSDLRAWVQHPAPVLDACWKSDGSGCFSAGCGNTVKLWSFDASRPGLQTAQDVGRHDAPVRSVRWIAQSNLLVSGGWDNKLNYWDLRQPNPVLSVQLPGRVDCMDVRFPYCCVATGGSEEQRQVVIYNLQSGNPSQPERVLNQPAQPERALSQGGPAPAQLQFTKPLKKQYRSIAIFPDCSGFAITSIEGRCSIQYFAMQKLGDNFAFKCHRDKNTKRIYSVNSLAFHPQFGTFATAGSDGIFNFWDKDSKQRLKSSNQLKLNNNPETPASIVSGSFSANGALYAYATSYDWSKGMAFNPGATMSGIMIHRTVEDQIKPKKATVGATGFR